MAVFDETDPFEIPVRLPVKLAKKGAPSKKGPERKIVAEYNLRLSPEEVLERLVSQEEVLAMRSARLPEFQPPVRSREFTATIVEDGFILHRAASERGHSGTGLLPNLYLNGTLVPTAKGSRMTLSFAYGRASWVWQRGAGLILVTLLSLVWVAVGQAGTLVGRLGAVVAFLLFVSPLVFNDLTRRKRMMEDRAHLLSLTERLFGRDAIAEASDAPYREG
jgi:hypothetical protein